MAKRVEAESRIVRRSAAQGRALVERYRASGQSVAAFCGRSGVGAHVLRYWLNKEGAPKARPSDFFVVSPPPRSETEASQNEAVGTESRRASAFIVVLPGASSTELARTVRELLAETSP